MKQFINATLFISVVMTLLVTSCQKDVSIANPASPDALSTAETKLFYEQIVVGKEQDRNTKAASLSNEDAGIFKRMEKLGQKVQWDKPQEFTNGKIAYLAFSLNEKDPELITGNKMHRTFIFSKAGGNIQMQICETMGTEMPTATILSQIKAALENHDLQKISAVSSGSANLYFYNDSYRSIFSCRITSGKFENTAEAIKLKVVNNVSSVASITANSSNVTCALWGHYLVWWENGVYHETLIYTYTKCSGSDDMEIIPYGDGGGGNEAAELYFDLVSQTQVANDMTMSSGGPNPNSEEFDRQFSWRAVKNLTWGIYSYENAVLKETHSSNPNLAYEFVSLTHQSIGLLGMPVGGTVEPILMNQNSYVATYNAGIQLTINIKFSPLGCAVCFATTIPYSCSNSFSAN